MNQLIPILGFLLYILLFLTLRYGYHHHNKYIKIYSICAIAWTTLIFVGGMEFFGVVLYRLPFYELNLIGLILPLIPLWIIYHKRDRTEERIEDARLSRQHGYRFKGDTELFDVFLNAGGKKCPKCGSTNFKIMRNYQIFECMAKECRWLYIDETNRMNQLLNPELQPLTEAQKRQIALEKEREKKEAERQWALEEERRKKEAVKRKKEAEKEAEKKVKDMTDDELLDEYITVDINMAHAGMTPTGYIGEHYWKYRDSLIGELKRRGITNEQIETRRKVCIPDARTRAEIWTDNEETWEQYRRRVYGLTTEEKEKEKMTDEEERWDYGLTPEEKEIEKEKVKGKRCEGCGTTEKLIFRNGSVVCENCYECSFDHDRG